MKNVLAALALMGSLMASADVSAAVRTVTFAIENMNCASCPFIVRQSMAAVPGVSRVDVSFEAQTATVTFDDAMTTVDAIAAASTDAGYPARPSQEGG